MSKTDICASPYYIDAVYTVIKANNRVHPKPLFVNGRHSDAFVYIIEGGCHYSFDDGEQFSVTAGDILYLASGAVYRMDVEAGDYRFIYCDFSFCCPHARKSAAYSSKNSGEVYQQFEKLYHCYISSSSDKFFKCITLLYHIYHATLQASNTEYVGASVKHKMEQIKEYIEQNCHDADLCVASLAKQAGMSDVYLRRLFHSLYNVSPSHYIIQIRIERAKQLMEYPFISLEDCALQSGFSSLSYFSRVFKNIVGISPAAYRKQRKTV